MEFLPTRRSNYKWDTNLCFFKTIQSKTLPSGFVHNHIKSDIMMTLHKNVGNQKSSHTVPCVTLLQ
jgi:hypothetical protein